MKNIVILGVPRAGKTTLARMIQAKSSKYQIITGDAVRDAFTLALPNNNINAFKGEGMKEDFPKFLCKLFYEQIRHNKQHLLYILDTCDIQPKHAYELFNLEKDVVIFLGYPSITLENKMKEIRKHETDEDWTKGKEDKRISGEIAEAIEKSIKYEKECNELGIRYIDTSYNRKQILENLVNELL